MGEPTPQCLKTQPSSRDHDAESSRERVTDKVLELAMICERYTRCISTVYLRRVSSACVFIIKGVSSSHECIFECIFGVSSFGHGVTRPSPPVSIYKYKDQEF